MRTVTGRLLSYTLYAYALRYTLYERGPFAGPARAPGKYYQPRQHTVLRCFFFIAEPGLGSHTTNANRLEYAYAGREAPSRGCDERGGVGCGSSGHAPSPARSSGDPCPFEETRVHPTAGLAGSGQADRKSVV